MSPCHHLEALGRFESSDLYIQKRRRWVQHIVNEYWFRWCKEFLGSLQERQKWNEIPRNFQVGDIVLLRKEQQPLNSWPMVCIVGTKPDNNSVAWCVQLRIGNRNMKKMFWSPISKLTFLIGYSKNE